MGLSLLEEVYWKGYEEGRKEGHLLVAREYIICLLRLRLQNVPDSYQARLDAIDDQEFLDFLYDVAVGCPTVEEFELELQKYENAVKNIAQSA